MPLYKFRCPHCQQKISADLSQSGISAQCPTCGGDFIVPTAAESTDVESPPLTETKDENPTRPPSESIAEECEVNPEPRPSHTFSERLEEGSKMAKECAKVLKEGAMVGWAGLKLRSKQAALKAQAEKLRNIDLRKILHTLGKKAFDQGVLETELAERFQAIRELDSRISEMREKAVADTGETKMETLKRVSKDTAKASHAQALTLKREHLITELGREFNARKNLLKTQELSEESAAIDDIERRIREKEEEIRELGAGEISGIQTLAVAAAIGILAITAFGLFRMIGNRNELASDSTDGLTVESSYSSPNESNYSATQSIGNYHPNSGDRSAIKRFNETYGVTHTIGKRKGMNDMEILRAAVNATDWSGASSDLNVAVKSFMSIKSGEDPASRNKKMEKFSEIIDAYPN
jgi:hypothetical protein